MIYQELYCARVHTNSLKHQGLFVYLTGVDRQSETRVVKQTPTAPTTLRPEKSYKIHSETPWRGYITTRGRVDLWRVILEKTNVIQVLLLLKVR